MGGEIAQVIASAGIPVVLKDVKQEFVDLGLKKAQEVTAASSATSSTSRRSPRSRPTRRRRRSSAASTARPSTRASATSTSSSRPCPSGWRSSRPSSPSSTRSRPATRSSPRTRRRCRSARWPTRPRGPTRSSAFTSSIPASFMRLVEVVEGADTSPETMQTATTFAQAIRKMPIACGEEPGFVVNRILNSAISEIWRFQEANGLSIKAIDDAVSASRVAPMGPFFLTDLLGLDTVLHVAEHLQESYGPESFYVHQGMKAYVEAGELGAKTGKGFYDNGQPRSEGETEFDHDELTQRFVLKAFVEACLVLEDGMATVRDIDLGMMAGAGLIPPPFAARRPDRPRRRPRRARAGDGRVGRAVRAAADPAPARRAGPPRREVRPGLLRLQAARRGLRAGRGRRSSRRATATRSPGWTARRRTRCRRRSSRSSARVWDHVDADDVDPRAHHRLGEPDAVVRGRRHQGVHEARRDVRRGDARRRARAAAADGALLDGDDRRDQRRRLRRRLRAGDGLRRADRRAVGELRPARGQPRHHPRLRRHAAPAAARRHGAGAGAQPHRRSDLRRRGVRDRPRQPRRARPRAARRGAGVGAQARRPGAAGGRGDQAHDGRRRRPRRGHRGREGRLREIFATADAREGIGAFLGKRTPQWSGK